MVDCDNRTIDGHDQLATFVQDHQRDCDQYLPLLLMYYRSAVQETTKCTPAILMFGQELRVSLDLLSRDPQGEQVDKSYPEYVMRLRASLQTVHNFACVHQ